MQVSAVQQSRDWTPVICEGTGEAGEGLREREVRGEFRELRTRAENQRKEERNAEK